MIGGLVGRWKRDTLYHSFPLHRDLLVSLPLRSFQTRMSETEGRGKEGGMSHSIILILFSSFFEESNPFIVVPSTRPILLLGPCNQDSLLTRRLHTALRLTITKKFMGRIRMLKTTLGERKQQQSFGETPLSSFLLPLPSLNPDMPFNLPSRL